MKKSLSCILSFLLVTFGAVDVRGAEGTDQNSLPAGWVGAWQQPPLSDRPLQIVHGINPRHALPDGVDQMVPGGAGAAGDHAACDTTSTTVWAGSCAMWPLTSISNRRNTGRRWWPASANARSWAWWSGCTMRKATQRRRRRPRAGRKQGFRGYRAGV